MKGVLNRQGVLNPVASQKLSLGKQSHINWVNRVILKESLGKTVAYEVFAFLAHS